MQYIKPSKTTAENNPKLEVAQEDSVRVDSLVFRTLESSLFFFVNKAKPDFIWITNVLSRFMNDPNVEHFSAGKRMLKYFNILNHLDCFSHQPARAL